MLLIDRVFAGGLCCCDRWLHCCYVQLAYAGDIHDQLALGLKGLALVTGASPHSSIYHLFWKS